MCWVVLMVTPTSASQRPSPSLAARDGYGWVVRVWLLVAAFVVVMVARSAAVGIPPRDPNGSILALRIALSLAILVVLAVVDAAVRAGGDRRRPRAVLHLLRRRWSVGRLVLVALGLLAYHLVYFSYHNLKSWDVLNRPRDGFLLRVDRSLFFGHDPAVLLHALLGQHVSAYVLMAFYESFSTVVSIALVASLAFTDRVRDGYVYIASALWVWILGVASYYAIPSLGPFHSAPQDFAGLPHTMIQDTQARYLAQRAHLLAHPAASDAFAQVSAFASLHVAVTTLLFLMARYYRLRRTSIALGVFVVITMVATVYLGWHFAVDDLAGLAIAGVSVFLGSRLIYPWSGRAGRTAGSS